MRNNIKSTFSAPSRLSLSETPQNSRDFVNQDSDFYRFRLRSASQVALGLSTLKRNADLSLYRLHKPFGKVRRKLGSGEFEQFSDKRLGRFLEQVGSSIKPGKRDEQLEIDVERGTYLIRVSSRSRKGTKYRLSAISSPATSHLEATFWDLSSIVEDSLSLNDPIDTYEFTLADRSQVSFNVSIEGANAQLHLLDSERSPLLVSSSQEGIDERIVANLHPFTTYFLEVKGEGNADYKLVPELRAQQQDLIYDGNGLLSESTNVFPIQIPITEDVSAAVGDSLREALPFELPPPSSDDIAPRAFLESLAPGGGTEVNTKVFPETSQSFVGYMSHSLDLNDIEIVSVFPEVVLDIGLLPLNSFKLDKNLGYTFSYDLDFSPEHSSNQDILFSIITVSDDGKSAIEIGFSEGQIFARDENFEVAEKTTLDTDFSQYDLHVIGNQYSLFSGDNLLLSGPLREYNFSLVAADPLIPFNPYQTRNYFFFGDNSSKKYSEFLVENIEIYA